MRDKRLTHLDKIRQYGMILEIQVQYTKAPKPTAMFQLDDNHLFGKTPETNVLSNQITGRIFLEDFDN